jgi:putative tryptophan/tyrosine transport system substrate-binding protein
MASYIGRRKFLATLGSAAVAWPLTARAQQPERMRRIGVLMGYPENGWEGPASFAAFREGLEKLGWVEDRNRFDTRWATPDDAEARQRFAKELVALQPDLILSAVTPTTAALLEQTRTIPIVFATVADPVGSGFVASLARPGGNVTGFQAMVGSLAGKWLELLKEIAPRVARIAALFNPAAAPYAESTSIPSRPPQRPSQWRRLPHLFTTRPSSNPSSPNRLASRIVA